MNKVTQSMPISIKLFRSGDVEAAWQKRMEELKRELFELRGGIFHLSADLDFLPEQWKYINLFEDMDFLIDKGLLIEEHNHVYILKADYQYEDTKHHYVIIPGQHTLKLVETNETELWQIFAAINLIIERYGFKKYCVVKKDQGSIDYPHWHLLTY
jgi:hypothetical protein